MNDASHSATLTNLAVVRGAVSHDPQIRTLPSGGVVVQFDLATRTEIDGATTSVSVPIAWSDPTETNIAVVVAGAELVVVGAVRRRFFRVGGATQSRTEVIADTVIPARRHRTVANVLGAVADRLVE
jgi:single-strand DNA-binding protein